MAEATWWMQLDSPTIAAASLPGQFVMIGFGLDNVGAPFLPRPFSVGWRGVGAARAGADHVRTDRGGPGDPGRIGLLIREFGPGTRRLAGLRSGDEALLLGPLGRGFRIPRGRSVVCLAGGVGLAPFLFLAGEARRAGHDVLLRYGERTAARVFESDLIEELTGGPVEVWTEDGTLGRRGRVLDDLDLPGVGGDGTGREAGGAGQATAGAADAAAGVADRPVLLACGPTPMLHAAAELAARHGLELQVSVEEYMGCGVGTCQGCVVRGADGRWIKSCTEGPVFDARDLAWEEASTTTGELSWGG